MPRRGASLITKLGGDDEGLTQGRREVAPYRPMEDANVRQEAVTAATAANAAPPAPPPAPAYVVEPQSVSFPSGDTGDGTASGGGDPSGPGDGGGDGGSGDGGDGGSGDFKRGGPVGKGGGQVEEGEFVIRRSIAKQHAHLLHAINKGQIKYREAKKA